METNSLRDKSSKFCKDYGLSNWSVDDNGVIDIQGKLNLSHANLTEIPVPFGTVSDYVDFSFNKLSSFKNFPKKIGGNKLQLKANNFESLVGLKDIEFVGSIYLHENPIKSFQGFPSHYYGDTLTLSDCGLTTEILNTLRMTVLNNHFNLMIDNNDIDVLNLINIKFAVQNNDIARSKVYRQLLAFNNKIKKIKHIPIAFDHYNLSNNEISNLAFLKKVNRITDISLSGNKITEESFKGLLLDNAPLKLHLYFNPIKSLKELEDFNNYLVSNNKDAGICRYEELKADIEEQIKTHILLENL